MNYIKEINAFRNYLKTNSLEAITQALWYVVIDYHNSCNWERWIAIDNSKLIAELGISEKTLIKHRNILIQSNLLEYKSQQRKKSSGRYKLLSFELGEAGVKKTTGNIPPDKKEENKTAGKNTADHTADWKADHTADWKADRSDIYKLNEIKQNDVVDIPPSPPNGISKVVELYRKNNMGSINPLVADALNDIEANNPPELIEEAFKIAAINGASSVRYVEKILIAWRNKGIISLKQLEEHEKRKEAERNVRSKKAKAGGRGNGSQGDDQYSGIGISL